RVAQHDVVVVRLVAPVDALGAQPQKPLDLGLLVVGVEVEVVPPPRGRVGLDLLQRQLDAAAAPGPKQHPVGRVAATGDVVERGGPELDGARHVAHAPHHRTDPEHGTSWRVSLDEVARRERRRSDGGGLVDATTPPSGGERSAAAQAQVKTSSPQPRSAVRLSTATVRSTATWAAPFTE